MSGGKDKRPGELTVARGRSGQKSVLLETAKPGLSKFEHDLKQLVQRRVSARVDLARAELGELAVSIALQCSDEKLRRRWLESVSSIQFELHKAHARLDVFTFPGQTLASFLEDEAELEAEDASEASGDSLLGALAREAETETAGVL